MEHGIIGAVRAFFADEEGASAIEYGLIVALIAVVLIIVLTDVGSALSGLFGGVEAEIVEATPTE